MLKEFVDALAKQVQAANTPRMSPYDPRANLVYVMPDGTHKFLLRQRGPAIDHLAESVSSFIDYALWSHAQFSDGKIVSNPIVFVELTMARFFLSALDREDRVTLNLPLSEQWEMLRKINRKLLSHKDAIRMLRLDLNGSLHNHEAVVAKFRAVKWSAEDNSESLIERGKTSLGKSMTAKFVGVDDLPETLTFTIPVYASKFPINVELKFDVSPDAENKGFVFTAYPGQFEAAEQSATSELHGHLHKALGGIALVLSGQESDS